jgi:hypothetical protein
MSYNDLSPQQKALLKIKDPFIPTKKTAVDTKTGNLTQTKTSSGGSSYVPTGTQHLPGLVIPGGTPTQTQGSAPQLPTTTGQTGTSTPSQLTG